MRGSLLSIEDRLRFQRASLCSIFDPPSSNLSPFALSPFLPFPLSVSKAYIQLNKALGIATGDPLHPVLVQRQSDAVHEGGEFGLRPFVELHAGRPHVRALDETSALVDEFSERQADLGLEFVSDERDVAVEDRGGSRFVSLPEGLINAHQHFREGEAGHDAVRAALKFFEKVFAAEPAEDADVIGRQVQDPAQLGQDGLLFELDVLHSLDVPGHPGKLKLAGGVGGKMKESIQRAFSYLRANKTTYGVARPVDVSDFHVEAIDLLGNRVEAEIGVAFFIAAYSILRAVAPQPGLLILGDMSIQGNIKPARSLVEPLQVAMDNGAKRALIPIENKRNFFDVTSEVLENVDPIFFGDLRTAAFKALGLN